MSQTSPVPSTSNYELQQTFLRDQQQQISGRLFELGVVSRLLENNVPDAGARVELNGVAQFGKDYVPSYTYSREDEKEEKVLSLVAITPSSNGRSFTYFKLGMVDNTNTLFPYPGVDYDDAEAVHNAAVSLEIEKTDGILPNLSASLLEVFNPNTAIRKA